MNRDQKAAVIDEIAADISESQAIFAVDYRGITVAQADALRERLRDADASFRVVKNSLTERAAERAGAEQLKSLLQGPTALTFVRGDAAAAAKAVADFARTTQLLTFKGGVMDGATLSSADVGVISRLPSRDVLYGQLVGLIANPLSGLARTLNALIGGLAVGLGGVLAKKESGEVPAAPSPAMPTTSGAETAADGNAAEGGGSAAGASGPQDATTQADAADDADGPDSAAAAVEADAAAPDEALEAAVPQEEPDKEAGDALAEPAEQAPKADDAPVPQEEPDKEAGDPLAEPAGQAPEAGDAPVPQDEPDKEAGDALAQAPAETTAAAADAAAEPRNDKE